MIRLEQHASLIITDSGGVQKEAYFFKKNCLILRAETEWVEIVETGAAVLCNAYTEQIINGFLTYSQAQPSAFPLLYGKGQAAKAILSTITRSL